MKQQNSQIWREDIKKFKEKTAAFYAGEIDKASYKGISGYYGSYAQKGGKRSMLRLRMPAGQVTAEKMAFVARMIREHHISLVHFTTCQTIQLHDLEEQAVCRIMEEALENGIITMGGGGDYPRNVMCSPLSGTDPEEYFDVQPWAKAAGEYLLGFLKAEKLPRKLKVGFSGSPANVTHATYRDLGFAAREDGTFDVYSAGGLGAMPKLGVKVAEGVKPEKILYYVKAMWLTFRAYGNYENRAKARTRFMQDALGGPEQYRKAYLEKLEDIFASGENLDLSVKAEPVLKKGNGTRADGPRVRKQKQEGLYTVVWHPIGGRPDPDAFCRLSDAIGQMEGAEVRLAPDETAYIINLTGEEAGKVLELTADSAESVFETSVSCIGGSICQVGPRDSQALLAACVKAVREAELPCDALPQIHISGCPSSCGTHQTGILGFRGAGKMAGGVPRSAFTLYVGGEQRQGQETMGKELGAILEEEIPEFLVKLGRAAAESGMDFMSWKRMYPGRLEEIAAEYI